MKKEIIIGIISLIVLSISVIVIYPIYKEKKEINSIHNEIKLMNNYLEDKEHIDNLKNIINDDIASGKRKDIENNIDNYLNDLINVKDKLDNLNNKEKDLFKEFNKDKQEEITKSLEIDNNTIKEIKENLTTVKEKYQNKNEFIKDIKLDLLTNKIDELEEKITNNEKINTYLKSNNKTWNKEEDKVVFLKRKNYNEYQKLNINNLNYELISDTKGPNINAKDITINKGTKINIKDKVSCIDDVDDKVECQIDGTYDNNKIGTYKIKITSSDTQGNKTEKTINLKVQEKKVNKNKYYIEVIRNHNIVIVYGLDENNEYKKIVKVFTCSVGKNNKTPTGTFKTSDKSSWGWLVGNVYGQYYTRITGSILFHSVPYYKKNKSTLEWEEYNKLGTAASKGCVRLAVSDVKWIYDNCKSGTTVKIYDGEIPKGITKPSTIKIDASSPNKGWDPTDPDKNNPWKK